MTGIAPTNNAQLLIRAQAGDELAWRQLVDGHAGLVWSIIRTFAIGTASQEDVFQAVWLRLAESMGTIRNPDRLAAWLARVARNEAIGVYRARQKVTPLQDIGVDEVAVLPDPDHSLVLSQTQRSVRAALARLGGRCQRLLTLLTASESVNYEEVSTLMDLPIGSIGPTRARCLEKLRNTNEMRELIAQEAS